MFENSICSDISSPADVVVAPPLLF